MCGIAGFINHTRTLNDLGPSITKMTEQLYARGPDGQGIHIEPKLNLAFGHRRLSIQDTSEAGKQPMHSSSERYLITFNGEVYNFLELKVELKQLGHEFFGGSDTEVMLAAFEEWGIEAAIKRFTGMFAFAVLDKKKQLIYLVRDRLGEKPLYFGLNCGDFIFASTLKAFKPYPSWQPQIDAQALRAYLRFNQVPAPLCIYEGIFKLKPGHFQCFDLKSQQFREEQQSYWQINSIFTADNKKIEKQPDEDIIDEMDGLLSGIIKNQMISDVPLGAFLSGGVDSSLIVSLMQKQSQKPINTFTIGFGEKEFNEAVHAKAVAKHLGCQHHELYIQPEEAREVIPNIPEYYDEPFADASQIPTYLVCKMAKTKVTVALSGDGGDEAFAGYSRYFQILEQWHNKNSWQKWLNSKLPAKPIATLLRKHPRFKDLGSELISAKLKQQAKNYKQQSLIDFYEEFTYPSVLSDSLLIGDESSHFFSQKDIPDPLHNMMLHDYHVYLPGDILTKVDRAAMANSLETRVPMLDHQWLEFVLKIPSKRNNQNNSGKQLLKGLLYRYVPQEIVDRPKQGFAIPIGPWLRGELKDWAQHLLFSPGRLELFNINVVKNIWQAFLRGRDDNNMLLWRILMFEAWHRQSHN